MMHIYTLLGLADNPCTHHLRPTTTPDRMPLPVKATAHLTLQFNAEGDRRCPIIDPNFPHLVFTEYNLKRWRKALILERVNLKRARILSQD
jgi:hypothetical protein